jgi:hypothetical protein
MAKKATARKQATKPKKPAAKMKAKAAPQAQPKKQMLKGKQPPAAPAKAGKVQGKPGIPPVKHVKGKGMTVPIPAPKAMPKAPIAARQQSNHDPEAVCREVACEGLSTTAGYCRLHYIKNWKKIKRKELILKEKKLNQYIEELVVKYPDKYIEAIRQDLASDRDFAKVITDLDLDESIDDFDAEGETVDSVIDNIKREFDDDGDAF